MENALGVLVSALEKLAICFVLGMERVTRKVEFKPIRMKVVTMVAWL